MTEEKEADKEYKFYRRNVRGENEKQRKRRNKNKNKLMNQSIVAMAVIPLGKTWVWYSLLDKKKQEPAKAIAKQNVCFWSF